MKTLISTFLLSILASCGGIDDSVVPESKSLAGKGYKVYFLFEHEGCKVYSFDDPNNQYRTIYFTNCNGSTEWVTTERHGKSSISVYHNVPTSKTDTTN